MMFNGEGSEKLNSHSGVEVAEGVIAAFYNEIQQSIPNELTENMEVEEVQSAEATNFLTLKDTECSTLPIEGTAVIVEEPSNPSASDFIALSEAACSTLQADDDSLKVQNDEIPDSWNISILESNEINQETEETNAVDDGTQFCQLFECHRCSALFRDKETWELHFQKAHDFTCGLCKEPFEEKEAFESHIIQHIAETPGHELQKIEATKPVTPTTRDSGTSPGRLENMDNALSSEGEEILGNTLDLELEENWKKSYKCDQCGKSFASKLQLSKHEESHIENLSHVGKPNEDVAMQNSDENSFSDDDNDEEEEFAISKGRSQFVCEVCEKDCYSKNALLVHLKKRHSVSHPKRYICELCGKAFQWKLALKNHQVIKHSQNKGMKLFPCHLCDESFPNAQILEKHLLLHEDLQPFVCDFCGARFKHSANHLNHIKTAHPNGQEFPCPECGKAFKSKTYLDAHISEVHMLRELEKCQYCQKNFNSALALKNHIQIHHNIQKNYRCDFCPSSFGSSKDLVRHMTVHTGIKDFHCDLCGRSFTRRENLKAHVKSLHKSEYGYFLKRQMS